MSGDSGAGNHKDNSNTATNTRTDRPTGPRLQLSLLDRAPQIVVGILFKHIGLQWKPRLFVLQEGVLKYYKINGPNAVSVYSVLETLRQQGDLFPIGAEISVLEARDKSLVANAHPPSSHLPPPRTEVHMQVGYVRESKSDGRKFHVETGSKLTLTLRAETTDDRWVWVNALRSAKGAWDGMTPTAAGALTRVTPPSAGHAPAVEESAVLRRMEVESALEHAKAHLAALGASKEVVQFVLALFERTLVEKHQMIDTDEHKRQVLLDIIYRLENEKRALETAIVVEGRVSSGAIPGVAANEEGEEESRTSQTSQTTESDNGEEEEVLMEVDDSGDEFFECETRLNSRPSLSRSGSCVGLSEGWDEQGTQSRYDQQNGQDDRQQLQQKQRQQQQQQQQKLIINETKDTENKIENGTKSKNHLKGGWLSAEGPPPHRRDRLPTPLEPEKRVSLWSLIKEMVGKDLTRVCLPVYFNEPLSALQKTAEDLEYSELLDLAAKLPKHSIDRLLRVAAFAVSAYSSTVGRTAKPFNPLLGETYELVHVEKGFRFLAEKVSHHPTIIAAVAEGRGWRFEGDADVKSKFWGRSIELKPEGILRLTFHDGDVYTWSKVTTSINNLILGKIYIDHGGIMRVRNHGPEGLSARLRFKETGMLLDRDPRQVRGVIERGNHRLDYPILHGHWDDRMWAELEDGRSLELWRKAPPPPDPTRYNLTSFAIQLNELTPGLKDKLAPTDCRLRPDQSATEKGMWSHANAEKQRLEHKQRAARKAADAGEPIRPRWFRFQPDAAMPDPEQGLRHHKAHRHHGRHGHHDHHDRHEIHQSTHPSFVYSGGYWEARASGNWVGCRDIFGPEL